MKNLFNLVKENPVQVLGILLAASITALIIYNLFTVGYHNYATI